MVSASAADGLVLVKYFDQILVGGWKRLIAADKDNAFCFVWFAAGAVEILKFHTVKTHWNYVIKFVGSLKGWLFCLEFFCCQV